METNSLPDKRGLKLKFAGLYVLSVALLGFIVWLLVPRNAPGNTVSAKPLENNEATYEGDVLDKLEMLNVQYRKLKQLDREYNGKAMSAASSNELADLNQTIAATERSFSTKIDSIESLATSYQDQKSANLLRSFTESYRLVANERSSLKAFRIAATSNANTDENQQVRIMMQSEIQSRDSRIASLENQINAIKNKPATPAVTVTPDPVDNRAEIDALERKIANLTAANAALERAAKANNDALEQSKKLSDNNSAASKSQVATYEKRVNDLNADVRLAQVDCNLARVDATQIISNAKQRKALLAEALNTLNTLAASGDASLKRKVSEKMIRLNQVASTLRD